MASGVPVISSNTGGLAEVNIDGVSGFLSNVGDVDTMAKQGLHILRDDAVLLKFKQQAKEASRKFDTENIIPLYEEVYENATKKVL
jgi:Glycosyltransferase